MPANLGVPRRSGTNTTRLVLGELPKSMCRQTQNGRRYRRMLEEAITELRGEVNLTDAHLVDEASQAEMHAGLCRWLMRNKLDTMSVADIRACSEQILKAKTARNKAVERLKLTRDGREAIDELRRKLYGDILEVRFGETREVE